MESKILCNHMSDFISATKWNDKIPVPDSRFCNFKVVCNFRIIIGSYVPVKWKLQRAPPPPPKGNAPGIWIFEKILFQFPPPEAEKLFKCPIIGPFQVIKCS